MQTRVRAAPYSGLPENTNPCAPATWVCFPSGALLFTKALGGPGPSPGGRPTRAPHGTLVYIQTQIITGNHFKKPWVRTCSRVLFEVFFSFFARAHFPDLFLKTSRPTAHHIFHHGAWNLGGLLGGGVTCVQVRGLEAPLLDSRTEFFSDMFPFSFFL